MFDAKAVFSMKDVRSGDDGEKESFRQYRHLCLDLHSSGTGFIRAKHAIITDINDVLSLEKILL